MTVNTGTQNLSYFNTRAVSNSLMTIYEDNFFEFVGYWVYKNPLVQKKDASLTLGTIIDTKLTRPEEVEEKFFIYDGKPPTGQLLTFVEELIKTSNCNYEAAYGALKAQNPKLRDSLEKFIERFENEAVDYYDTLMLQEKTVVSSDLMSNADVKIQELRSNKFTRILVNAETTQNIEVFYQVEIFTQVEGVPVKGAIDKLIVDHKRKKIIPIDFKSSYDPLSFPSSVIKWKYYRQGSFYKHLLTYWMEENNLSDYEVTDFMFVVIGTIKANQHLIYRLSEADRKVAELGGYFKNGIRVKGWREILQEIKFLQDEGSWSFPYEVIANNGIIELDLFKDGQ